MRRRTLLTALASASALRAQQAPDHGDKLYFDVVRDMYPVRTGIKRLARTELQFPKLGDYQVVTADFHIHTLYSEGTVMPSVRLYEAWSEGVDVVAFTDHAEFLRTALPDKKGRATEEVRGLAEALNLVLIRGAEVSTVYSSEGEKMRDVVARANTDFIVLFVQDENALFAPFDIAMERARQQGCLNIWAHPGKEWRPWPQKFLDMGWLHGVEIRNTVAAGRPSTEAFRGRYFYPQVADWARDKKLALIASSDVHSPAQFEREPGQARDYTLLLVKERSAEGVREALLNQRTIAWFEDMLWGRQPDLELLISKALRVELLRGDGRIQGLLLRNLSSLPLELEFVRAAAIASLPAYPIRIPKLGSTVVPAGFRTQTPPTAIAVRLANVFVTRDTPLEFTTPIFA